MPSHHLNIHHRQVEPIFHSNANSPDPNFNGVSGPKGSRFAKFFDGKGRDGVISSKQQLPGGFPSPSPNQNHRPEQPNFGGINVNPSDGRTMDDLFAMLRNSTQASITTLVHPLLSYMSPLARKSGPKPQRQCTFNSQRGAGHSGTKFAHPSATTPPSTGSTTQQSP
jgi:hypothetical protein